MQILFFILTCVIINNVASSISKKRKDPDSVDNIDSNDIDYMTNLPINCLEEIMKYVKDPYDIANLMATCKRAKNDITELSMHSKVIQKASSREILRRNQFLRISSKLSDFLIYQKQSDFHPTPKNIQITSDPGLPEYRFDYINSNDFFQCVNNPKYNGKSYRLLFIHPSHGIRRHVKIMVFGLVMDKSFLMYSALRKLKDISNDMLVGAPVISGDGNRSLDPRDPSGFVYDSPVTVYQLPKGDWTFEGNLNYLDISKMMYMMKLVLLSTGRYLEQINLRFSREILNLDGKLICTESLQLVAASCHLLLDPLYTSAFYSTVPNENGMLIVSVFSKALRHAIINYHEHEFYMKVKKFFCKFSLALDNVVLVSPGRRKYHRCRNSDNVDIFDDTVSIDVILKELNEIYLI